MGKVAVYFVLAFVLLGASVLLTRLAPKPAAAPHADEQAINVAVAPVEP